MTLDQKLLLADAVAGALGILVTAVTLGALWWGCIPPTPAPVGPTVHPVSLDAAAPLCERACLVLDAVQCPEANVLARCVEVCQLAPSSNVSAFDPSCVVDAGRSQAGVRGCGVRCLP